MKTIKLSAEADPAGVADEVARVIRSGGLVCLPCGGRYRLIADLEDSDAVIHLMQAKSRVKTAPALVFIEGVTHVDRVADGFHALAQKLADAFWPGLLTIRVVPSPELPRSVIKHLGGRKSRIGIRTPSDPLMRAIVSANEGPLLVSSANRQKKAGESSPAQVRKTFRGRVALFVDGGDLTPGPKSTVVAIVDDAVVVEREGAIDAAELKRVAG